MANAWEVAFYYYIILFRVTGVRNCLRTPDKPIRERISLASEQYKIKVDTIKEFWNLDEDNQPTKRIMSLKEMARILAARKYGITQHRVSNILAS